MDSMRRSRANRIRAKAEMTLAHQQDPEARREIRGQGLAVGKRVLYRGEGEPTATRYGTVKEMHRESVEIEVTVGNIMTGGENAVIRKDEVPYPRIIEIIGEGQLANPALEPAWNKEHQHGGPGPAPPRAEGYEECELGGKRGCGEKPYKAYTIRKLDKETGLLGPTQIVAICKSHDEPYIEAKCRLNHDHSVKRVGERLQNSCNCTEPSHIPLLWQLGVVFDEFTIPREIEVPARGGNSDEIEPIIFDFCHCGKPFGHRGFHRKVKEEEDG